MEGSGSPKRESQRSGMEVDPPDANAIGVQKRSTSSDEVSTTTPEEALVSQEETPNRGTSFVELSPQKSDSDDDDVEIRFGQFTPFSKRRTFSQCDSPIDPTPQWNIYDTEAENKETGSSDQENKLQKFMEESAAWSQVRRRFKPTRAQRDANSDGAAMNMNFINESETSAHLTKFLLKRSLSAPPDSSSDNKQRLKVQIKNFYNRLVSSASKLKPSKTGSLRESSKPSSESQEDSSCSSETVESTSSSAWTSESDIKTSSEETNKPRPVITYEVKLTPDDITKPSSRHVNEPSSGTIEQASARIETSTPFEEDSSSRGLLYRLLTSEGSSKENYSELYGGKPRRPTGSDSDTGTSSSENAKASGIRVAETPTSLQQCDEVSSTCTTHQKLTCPTDSSKQESPPKITSEYSSSDSGAIKVPGKLADPKTPEPFDFRRPSPVGDDNAVGNGSARQRPSDLNVKRRSAFYSFSSSSPTNLVLRPYHSLPNVYRPPEKNSERRSIGLEDRRRRVVRSLFTGNFQFRGYTPGSNVSSVSKEILSLGTQPSDSSSDERPSGGGSKGHDSKEKSKVCKKLVFPSPSRETNVSQTLQDHSSSELIGEISSLTLNVPSTSEGHPKEESTPKRKEVSPTEIAGASLKKLRSSPEFDENQTIGQLVAGSQETKVEESEVKGEPPESHLKLPGGGSTKESISPKRKVGDLEVGTNPGSTHEAEDPSPESALKRTRMKPPTPEGELDNQANFQRTEKRN